MTINYLNILDLQTPTMKQGTAVPALVPIKPSDSSHSSPPWLRQWHSPREKLYPFLPSVQPKKIFSYNFFKVIKKC